jgi:AhpD family alkylhydroperoxidase
MEMLIIYQKRKEENWMSNNYYHKENLKNLNQLKILAAEQFQGFSDFNSTVFKPGSITTKEKEIIAVSISHVTGCPYCIDSHTRRAKVERASM